MKVFGVLKMGDTWAYLSDDRNDSIKMKKFKWERHGITEV